MVSTYSYYCHPLNLDLLLVYLNPKYLMQVFQPWIQRRRIDYAKHRHVISGVLKHLKMRAIGRLLTNRGEPNREVIDKLVFFLPFALSIKHPYFLLSRSH